MSLVTEIKIKTCIDYFALITGVQYCSPRGEIKSRTHAGLLLDINEPPLMRT